MASSEAEVKDSFLAAMREFDIVPTDQLVFDGRLHRFHVVGDRKTKRNGWYVAYLDDHPAGMFGCKKRLGDDKKKWSWRDPKAKPLTSAERRALREKSVAQKKERDLETTRLQSEAAAEAQAVYDAAEPCISHPYLKRKGIDPLPDYVQARLGKWEITDRQTGEIRLVSDRMLVIPMRDASRTLRSLQGIMGDGTKLFWRGGEIKGKIFTIGKPREKTILICEGFATGVTLARCTGHAVAVAFTAGNLGDAAREVRRIFKDYVILICADNDQFTLSPIENPGVHFARLAAQAISGLVAVPRFSADIGETKETDFNDLESLEGEAAVRDQIEWILNPPEPDSDDMPPPSDDDPEPFLEGSDNPYFRVLGYDHGHYYIFSYRKRQVLTYTKSDFNDGGFVELAPPAWWEMHFGGEKGINRKMAANALITAADRRGIFNPATIRGRGAWFDESRTVYHHGGFLTVDGKRMEVTAIRSHFVYELGDDLRTPADVALTDAEGYALMALASRFRWVKPGSAALLVGWCLLAPLGGVLNWRPHIWLAGNAGCGKALCNAAKILTPSGWRNMGDIRAGDYVTTPDNRFGKVLKVFPQGKLKVYKLTFGDGRTVRASGDHLWKVRIQRVWRLCTTDDLIAIAANGTSTFRRLAIPLADALTIDTNMEVTLPMHPYVLGAMLGDGSMGGPSFTCFDTEITERIQKLLPDGTSIVPTGDSKKGQFKFKHLSAYGRTVRKIIKELRMTDSRSHSKFIPKEYLNSSIADRIQLLQGLMDTDGTICKGGSLGYCTISPQLCKDVVYLVRSLGGKASVYKKEKTGYTYKGEKRYGQPAYVIAIKLKDRASAFNLKRKKELAAENYQYADCLYLNVKSIEPDGEDECSCIVIDHPDQLFITDDFVVTHNSTVLRDFVNALTRGINLYAQGNTTEPGIRQRLKTDAIPVLFDESEQNEEKDKNRVQAIIALMRQSSTESDARTYKGTTFGHSMDFIVRSMFCLASIQVGIKHQADVERLAILSLKSAGKDVDAIMAWKGLAEDLTTQILHDKTISQRLFRRSLNLLPTILKNIEVFTEVAAKFFKSQRAGDQYGALLAGAFSMMRQNIASESDAEDLLTSFDWSEHIENSDTDEGAEVLQVFLECHIRVGITPVTVYELLRASAGYPGIGLDIDSSGAQAILARYGIKVDDHWLMLSNNSMALRALMKGTNFDADWRGVMLRIDGADRNGNRTIWFNGVPSKVIRVPLKPLMSDPNPIARPQIDEDGPPGW